MPRTKAIAAYADCEEAFKLALANEGLRMTFPDPKQAVNFRYRCHAFRKLANEQGVSIYAAFELTLEDNFLYFRPRPSIFQISTNSNLDGKPVQALVEDVEEELLEGVLALRKQLGLRDE
jgi:hypothetical protein